LKEQLKQLSADQESLTLEKEAEKLAKEEEALKKEADLRTALGTEFSTVKAGLKEGEELSNEQMIAIMAEAVGASSDAQSKLILKKVASMVGQSNDELKKTQKLLVELAACVSTDQTRSRHKDYDDYATEIAGIMSTTRGVSPEDAYLLAKAKKKGNQPEQRQTETERPGEIPNETSSRNDYVRENRDAGGVKQSARAVFQAAAEAAAAKVIAARQ